MYKDKKVQPATKITKQKKNIYPLGKKWLLLFGFLLILYLLIDYSSYLGIKPVVYILFVLGIIIPLINLRWGLFYYLTISLLSGDTSRILNSSHFISIHVTQLGQTTLITYLTIFIFLVAISYFLIKKRKKIKITIIDQLIIAVVILYCISGIIGLKNFLQFSKYYISDASYIINLVFIYFVIRLVITNKKQLKQLISLIILCFVVRSLVGIIYYYYGIGMPAGINVRTFYDSSRNLLPFIFFLCTLLALYLWKKISSGQKIILILFSLSALFHIITFASRGNMIFTGIGILLIILFLINRPLHIQKKILIKTTMFVILGIGLTLISVQIIRPGALAYPEWKIKSLYEVNTDSAKLSSTSSRILEFKNIFNHLSTHNNLLWGEGLGGWFRDEYHPYVHKLLGGGAYPDKNILERKIFKPHGSQFMILLKMGLGGLVIYYSLLMIIFIQSYKIFKKIKEPYYKAIALAITVFLPLLFYKNFISKIQIFFGIILAILACINCFKSHIDKNYQKFKKKINY